MTRSSGLSVVCDDEPVPTIPADDVRKAALVICENARDHADAALLLEALGIRDGRVLRSPSRLRTVVVPQQAALALSILLPRLEES